MRRFEWARRWTPDLERTTRVVVLGSVGAAIGLTAYVGSVWHAELPAVFAATFAGAFLLGALLPRGGVAVLLGVAGVVPALVLTGVGSYRPEYRTIWAIALFGAMLPRTVTRPWSLPPRWRLPLAGWALAVAVTWPLVVARETDFNAAQLTSYALSTSALGLRTPAAVLSILESAITLLVSLVWFDWLFAMFAGADPRVFRRSIVAPLLASCGVASAVAACQAFVDVSFLNPDFGHLRRTAGTMVDANAYGMMAALSIGATLAWLASSDRNRGESPVASATTIAAATFLVLLMWTGLWASGSRTSLMAGITILAFALHSWLSSRRVAGARGVRRLATAGAAGALIAAGFFISLRGLPGVLGAAQRLWWVVPGASGLSGWQWIQFMWDRDGYGAAALRMLGRSPLVGVGIGSFPILVPDYGRSRFGGPLAPDNAQNWMRHQLAELGILGSAGWLVWGLMCAAFLLRSRASRDRDAPTRIVRGTILALAAISLVGIPTQNLLVAVIGWTMMFWYALLMDECAEPGPIPRPPKPAVTSRGWLIAIAMVLIYMGGTWHAAATTLRVPMRARQFGWGYDYGFDVSTPDGHGGEYRWTRERGVAVVPALSRLVMVTVSADRDSIAAHPVRARVWHEDRLVIDAVLRDVSPVTAYVSIRHDPPWLMLTANVDPLGERSHAVPARGAGNRGRGLAVDWTFLPDR
jgi:hypothetical protein